MFAVMVVEITPVDDWCDQVRRFHTQGVKDCIARAETLINQANEDSDVQVAS